MEHLQNPQNPPFSSPVGGKLVLGGTERERHKELRHFSHNHPLTLNRYREYFAINYCVGCRERILGLGYSCKECRFFLHKSCGEQPRELQYPLHPQHPLILRKRILGSKLCYFCNKYIFHFSGFAYHCSHCNFSLHLKCASISLSLEAEFHDHPLKLLRKSVSFTCDICGKEDKDMSYLCITCPLMAHLNCAALPLTVKHTGHQHALNVIDSSQVNQSHRRICRLCVKKVDTEKVYYCSKCNFVAHLGCATREGDTDETFVLKFKDKQPLESTGMFKSEDSEVDESIDSLTYVVNKSKIGEDNIEIAEEINHFSHRHDLKLTEDELLNNEKCDGCMHLIFPPFYNCAQCRFFLHKSCVELPRKKRHPLHPHLLTLLAKAPYVLSGFRCDVCARFDCYGFTYHCGECWFDVDVQCSLISDIFTHDGHEHQLFLSRAPYNEKCSCCDHEGKVFRCADCEFTLDVRCATLPLSVRYRHFDQPFKLCYNTKDDYDEEYYCDICEERRDPKHWFYCCAELNFHAHPRCILGASLYMK